MRASRGADRRDLEQGAAEATLERRAAGELEGSPMRASRGADRRDLEQGAAEATLERRAAGELEGSR